MKSKEVSSSSSPEIREAKSPGSSPTSIKLLKHFFPPAGDWRKTISLSLARSAGDGKYLLFDVESIVERALCLLGPGL
jgi:hypothetical protein